MIPDEKRFRGEVHDERVSARLGLWLGVAFGLCFITGLISHFLQHPPGWFDWPTRPVWGYRVTQGVHVVSGVAAIPLLLAKLWSVYPKLFGRPLIRSPLHALERGSILLLSAAAFFELATGIFNVAQNYAFSFYFPPVHYLVAWMAIGSILVHVAVKLPVIRRAVGARIPAEPPRHGTMSRRGFLNMTALSTGVAITATAGATVPLLRPISVLSWRTSAGLPVNRTAAAARVQVTDPAWPRSLSPVLPRDSRPGSEIRPPQQSALAPGEHMITGALWPRVRSASRPRTSAGARRSVHDRALRRIGREGLVLERGRC
ncbi:MAG TPA: molybdopterin-binding protein [Amycolatopsis sp.]|nr:molybdopterin-binding protein [Amycolatopsis sp.]